MKFFKIWESFLEGYDIGCGQRQGSSVYTVGDEWPWYFLHVGATLGYILSGRAWTVKNYIRFE